MRKQHRKNIALVISLLDKPKWYNETITHPNWAMMKRDMKKYEALSVVNMPPTLAEHFEEFEELKSWYRSTTSFTLNPPKMITGVVAE